MKLIKKVSLITAIIIIMVITLTACGGETHTCSRCREEFTGNAYSGDVFNRNIIVCRPCAIDFWHPLNVDNFRVQS